MYRRAQTGLELCEGPCRHPATRPPTGDLCFIIDKKSNFKKKKDWLTNDFSQLKWHIHLAKTQKLKEQTFSKHRNFMMSFPLHLLFYFPFHFDRILGCVELKKPIGLKPICMFKIMHCQVLLWCSFKKKTLFLRRLTTLKETAHSFNP